MTPAEAAQQPSDVVVVISDAKVALDHDDNARAGPQIGFPSVGSGTLGEQCDEALFLSRGESGRSSRMGLWSEAIWSLLFHRLLPTVNRTGTGPDDLGDLREVFALAEQTHGPTATALQLLRGSWGSHGPDLGSARRGNLPQSFPWMCRGQYLWYRCGLLRFNCQPTPEEESRMGIWAGTIGWLISPFYIPCIIDILFYEDSVGIPEALLVASSIILGVLYVPTTKLAGRIIDGTWNKCGI